MRNSISNHISNIREAIETASVESVRELVSQDRSIVFEFDNHKCTLLHRAARKDGIATKSPEYSQSFDNHIVILKYLLALGSDVNATDCNHRTPLHEATIFGHSDVIKILFENGANPNTADKEGNTPLHLLYEEPLVMGGHIITAQVLLSSGANANIKNIKGFTPIDIARSVGDTTVAELLEK